MSQPTHNTYGSDETIIDAIENLAIVLMLKGIGMPELRFSKEDLLKVQNDYRSKIAYAVDSKYLHIPPIDEVKVSKIHTTAGTIELKEK